ncbi:MAG: hypothetical protein U9Q74_03785 [Gemmatimonadota bacterium]|nr:hypothetical protein [Gemmatimonadota bacterium]
MAFDLDAFRDAHRPWRYTAGGRTHIARPVSTPAVLAFHAEFNAAADEAGRLRALRRVLRLAFPRRISYRWRGDPVAHILGLEPAARKAAITDFFASLEGKSGPSAPPTTPGTPSSAPSRTA